MNSSSHTIDMETNQTTWNKTVHAPFKKVVKFDLICMGIGAVIGMGAGAYLVASGILG
jgi:hypothetical protein